MFDINKTIPITIDEIQKKHSKELYRSICVPSMVQSYSLCIEFMRDWFLSKFPPDLFKNVFIDEKNIYDDFRKFGKAELLKKQKPMLKITPKLSWDFNNENIDSYPYGLDLYTRTGRFKNSFFSDVKSESYMGIGMETMFATFEFRVRVETRAQQMDLYKYIQLACRVGFTCGQDVDLDFHIPYNLIIQLAKDNGFDTYMDKTQEKVKDVSKFLSWLNLHSTLPFLYKFRALNGNNEFFLRMRNMYIHIRPTDLSADDGEREGQLTNNFNIELQTEVRFPAPKMYAYYSTTKHDLKAVYGAWYQPHGPISTCYTFKGGIIPEENRYGWSLFMSTTYEDEDLVLNESNLNIDMSDLIKGGDIGECIKDCLSKSLSPSIFCDILCINGGDYIPGKMNWETLTFEGETPVRSAGTYIGIYIDKNYLANYTLKGSKERLEKSGNKIDEC